MSSPVAAPLRLFRSMVPWLLVLLAPGAVAGTAPALVPAPASLTMQEGSFVLRSGSALRSEGAGAAQVGAYLQALLASTRRISLSPADRPGQDLLLTVQPQAFDASASPERYRLQITADGIQISAPHARGLFYGAVTLWQLATPDAASGPVRMPALQIEDFPRFAWRGYMLDSARHFESVAQIEALLDAMALHKLNVFHWHLTDDQGWRVEIGAYPELTRTGGCRGRSEDPAAGRECGWYSQQQIRHIVAYAAQRNITVVPEIDMPGHATAAIAAYPELGVTGQRLAVSNERGVHANLFNVEESTFAFLDKVMDEIAGLFPAAFVHVGGDEAIKDQWEASPRVQARMDELGIADSQRLQSYFIGRMAESLARRGKRLIGWDEILEGGLPANAAVMSWRGTAGGLQAARLGHDVVMSPTRAMYLDYLQTASPNEPFGRLALNTLRDFYDFEPVPAQLEAKDRAHVLGLQSNMWTGELTTFDIIEHNTFPRLAATAETGWSPATRKDYADFLQRLPVQLLRYRQLAIAYARTPLEVMVDARPVKDTDSATVWLSTPLEYSIHYTLDGSAPTLASPRYAAALQVALPTRIRAATFAQGQRLDQVELDTRLDTAWLHRRDDTGMVACPDAPGPALRLAGSPDEHGKRPLYNVDIMAPCWQWLAAPTADMRRIRVRAARIPYSFRLTAAERDKRRFLPAHTAEGELDIRSGSCQGQVVASAPLPARSTRQGPTDIVTPLRGAPATTDLCIRFTGGTDHGLWVLDQVELLP